MIVETHTLPPGHTVQADVCIIGAGAAGITMARELDRSPLRVVLLESGGFDLRENTQTLASGRSVGQPYFPLEASRLRLFGGTTNHWGGYCDPMRPLDFEVRPGIPCTGWPITEGDLETYYARAATICQIARPDWDVAYWTHESDHAVLPLDANRVESRMLQILSAGQRNFGTLYRADVVASRNVELYLNANVTELVSNQTGTKVEEARVATLAGNRFSVAASHWVLAAGGIENARVLLLSNGHQPAGLGNERDLVGRFFADHPRLNVARFYPASPGIDAGFYKTHRVAGHDGLQIKGHFNLRSAVLRRESMLDVQLRLDPVYDRRFVEALGSKGGASLVYLAKSLWHGRSPDAFAKHLSRVVFDIENIPGFIYGKVREDQIPVDYYEVNARIDPTPNPDSRVRLSTIARDALGQPCVELDWRLTDRDRRAARRAAEILGQAIGASGMGRLQITLDDGPQWPPDTCGGFHHMGTTRMSNDPQTGVVDRHCRVHNVANLYVAGSSVFPTSGSGSPTLTIVALTLRLADHLKARLA